MKYTSAAWRHSIESMQFIVRSSVKHGQYKKDMLDSILWYCRNEKYELFFFYMDRDFIKKVKTKKIAFISAWLYLCANYACNTFSPSIPQYFSFITCIMWTILKTAFPVCNSSFKTLFTARNNALLIMRIRLHFSWQW